MPQTDLQRTPEGKWPALLWAGLGLGLLGLQFGVARLSSSFLYGEGHLQRPILTFVGLELGAGALYLAAVAVALRHRLPGWAGLWLVFVAVAMRLCFLGTNPIQEDDFYRYLWDGAVVAHGGNPYAVVPEAVREDPLGADGLPKSLYRLPPFGTFALSRVNHPDLRTIYPPVAQLFFALAYRVGPWSLKAWRLVCLGLEAVTVVLLFLLLRRLALPGSWMVIYLWSPLVAKELVNTAHMDVVLLPFLVLTALLLARGRPVWATVSLALAVGAKLWPVVLLPVVLRPLVAPFLLAHGPAGEGPKAAGGPDEPVGWLKRVRWRPLGFALAAFASLVVPMIALMALSGPRDSSGVVAFAEGWEINDVLFMVVLWGAKAALGVVGLSSHAALVTRVVTMAALVAFVVYVVWRTPVEPRALCRALLLVTAALFLLSPAQFPWYYSWVLVLLAVSPRPSLLLLGVLLPLYYLRFYFDYRDQGALFHYRVVWVEYLPVFGLILWELLGGRFPLFCEGRRPPVAP